ncbi:MAG: DUF6691 family protein [Dokdonia sp.]|jgi:uncharacterized membrane protein YedE/YeeE
MKKYVAYFTIGIFFGILMYKSEAASWFRIYEMFRFDSFHMYGIIGSALVIGVIGVQWIKRKDIKALGGRRMQLNKKQPSIARYLIGGTLFGLGWALAGACPGPMYVLLGSGYPAILVVLFGAVVGTFVYGIVRDKLPH